MANSKYFIILRNLLGVLFILALIAVVVLFVVAPAIWDLHIPMGVYIHAFLLLGIVGVFALLRLYNAIVVHTKFNIKLMESVKFLRDALPNLNRSLDKVSSALNSSAMDTKKLNDTIGASTTGFKESMEQILKNLKELFK